MLVLLACGASWGTPGPFTRWIKENIRVRGASLLDSQLAGHAAAIDREAPLLRCPGLSER
jgi:hypothetical protein